MPFVSWVSADEHAAIQRVIAEEREHQAALAECIVAEGGAPAPITSSLALADVHYLELRYLLPRIIGDKRRLVRLYEAAADHIDPSGGPGQQVCRILAAKREHLAGLQRLGEAVTTSSDE